MAGQSIDLGNAMIAGTTLPVAALVFVGAGSRDFATEPGIREVS